MNCLYRFAIPIHSPQFVDGADEADFMEAMRCIRQEQDAEDALARSEFMDDATGSVSEDSLIPLCHSYVSLQNVDADITLDHEDALHPTRQQQEAPGPRATPEVANDAIGPVSKESLIRYAVLTYSS